MSRKSEIYFSTYILFINISFDGTMLMETTSSMAKKSCDRISQKVS